MADGTLFALPLTQEQLGDHLGLSYVHINRTLRQLHANGLVLMRCGWADITDMDGLRRIALLDGKHPCET